MTLETNPNEVHEGHIRDSRGFSIIWLVPLVAILIGAGIAYQTIQSRGPVITLVFSDASGLEAGKTKIKYKSLEVGVVTDLDLSPDLASVIATAELAKGTEPHLTDTTIFWKVTPQVSFSGVSGLDTLLSGSYLAVMPQGGGEPAREFQVAAQAPPAVKHRGALAVELLADDLGSVGIGSPVLYRSIRVGEVVGHDLVDRSAGTGGGFVIHTVIDQPYRHLVREGTEFWNASGLDIELGSGGLQVQLASLTSLLSGGIAFDTAPWRAESDPIASGARFDLHPSYAEVNARRKLHGTLEVVVESRDARGMAENSPVLYRNVQIGRTGRVELSPDATSVKIPVHIERRFAPLVRTSSRFWNATGLQAHVGLDGVDVELDSLTSMLSGGLALATPASGRPAEAGHLFALADEPEEEWLAWAPEIWVGERGSSQRVAHVLERVEPRRPGLRIILESYTVASVSDGSPIYYREVQVGKVEKSELSKDARTVRIHAHIESQFASLVRSNTRFWNTSGIEAHLGIDGLTVDTGSVESLLRGGIAFATPDEPGPRVKAGTLFPLHARAEDPWLGWTPTIWVEKPKPGEVVRHALQPDEPSHLFGGGRKPVQSEAVAPSDEEEMRPVSVDPANVAAAGDAKQPGFFQRLFGLEE